MSTCSSRTPSRAARPNSTARPMGATARPATFDPYRVPMRVAARAAPHCAALRTAPWPDPPDPSGSMACIAS
ncbi:MAG: hypothetical protein R2755_02255 [Acidimicrobiales bacterium]